MISCKSFCQIRHGVTNGISSLLLACILAFSPHPADASLADIKKLLSSHSSICANFTQRKSLKVLTRPLVSKGRLVYRAGQGVLWQVREPFAAQLLIKRDALFRWNDDGVIQKINVDQTPVFQALSDVFLALFSGDLSRLQDIFDVETQSTRLRWSLGLIPRTEHLAAIITSVEASGNQFVDELSIVEKQGDRTTIRFSEINGETCRLQDSEKAYFAQ